MSPWGHGDRCYLVALYRLLEKRPNLEVANKRLHHQQVKYRGSFSAMLAHGSASLKLFLVVWIFLRSLGIIFITHEFSVKVKKITGELYYWNLRRWFSQACSFWDLFLSSDASISSTMAFHEWVHVGIDVYIPHLKYQIKPEHGEALQNLMGYWWYMGRVQGA